MDTYTRYQRSGRGNAPTPKQQAYMGDLIDELVAAGHDHTELRHAVGRPRTKQEASGKIRFLQSLRTTS